MRHFNVDPVLKIDETFYKQAESMLSLESLLVKGGGVIGSSSLHGVYVQTEIQVIYNPAVQNMIHF